MTVRYALACRASLNEVLGVLNRMYGKREKTYKALGYAIARPGADEAQAELRFAAIEQIAVSEAIAFEEARGCKVESVESDTRGFDLISPRTVETVTQRRIETRFIEVKGRAAIGEIALTANEYKTAQRLGDDYWLYVVYRPSSEVPTRTNHNSKSQRVGPRNVQGDHSSNWSDS